VKKIYSVVAVVMVLVTPIAQAKTCLSTQCNYITNGSFPSGSTTGWTLGGGNGVSVLTDTSCYGSKVIELQNTEYAQQSFYVDDTYNNGFRLVFRTYHTNDTDNWYDQLKVTVTNTDTNQSETMYLHGNSYSTHCNLHVFSLSNNYSNANVTVKFEVAYLATGEYQIDDVAFWAEF
jgi:hypothetical protein